MINTFADDAAIISPNVDYKVAYQRLQTHINKIQDSGSENGN